MLTPAQKDLVESLSANQQEVVAQLCKRITDARIALSAAEADVLKAHQDLDDYLAERVRKNYFRAGNR
jgi:hypothetical protein